MVCNPEVAQRNPGQRHRRRSNTAGYWRSNVTGRNPAGSEIQQVINAETVELPEDIQECLDQVYEEPPRRAHHRNVLYHRTDERPTPPKPNRRDYQNQALCQQHQRSYLLSHYQPKREIFGCEPPASREDVSSGDLSNARECLPHHTFRDYPQKRPA